MDYLAVRHMHMGLAALSGSFFLLRRVWMLRASPLLQQRWVRIAPHVIDTLLLASAFFLMFVSGQYPFAQPWLGAKVCALVLYIVLGTVALKRGRTARVRALAFGGAVLAFAYIAAVAVTRQVIPFS
jgi:uncharacterized membrane protein SirB2